MPPSHCTVCSPFIFHTALYLLAAFTVSATQSTGWAKKISLLILAITLSAANQFSLFWAHIMLISYSVYVPKIMKIGWRSTKLLQKLPGLLFWPTLYIFWNRDIVFMRSALQCTVSLLTWTYRTIHYMWYSFSVLRNFCSHFVYFSVICVKTFHYREIFFVLPFQCIM